MTPRARRRLLVAVLVLAVPLMLAVVLLWFVASGGLQRQIQQYWAAHYPGTLSIGAIEFQGLDHLQVRDLTWQYQGHDVAGIAAIDIEGAVFQGSLRQVRVTSPFVVVDEHTMPAWEQAAQRLGHEMSQRDGDFSQEPLALLLEQGRLAVDAYELRDLRVSWQGEGGDGRLEVAADTPAGAWLAHVALDDDGVEVQLEQLPLDIPALVRALELIRPGLMADLLGPDADPEQLPEQLQLAGSQLRWTAPSGLQADLQVAAAAPWQGLNKLHLEVTGDWRQHQAKLQGALQHSHGESAFALDYDQEGLRLSVDDDAAALPVQALARQAWPQSWPELPAAVGVAGTQLQRSPQGLWTGVVQVHFLEPWLGMRALRADDLHLPESTALLAGAGQHWQAKLSMDAGFGDALGLLLWHHRQRSAYTAAVESEWRLRFAEGPVRRQTLLAVPRALGLMDGWRPWIELLIPGRIDLADTHVHLAMPDLQAQLRLAWHQGHLHADIDSSLIDWRVAPLAFEHAALGSVQGEFYANEAMLRGRWSHLRLRPRLLPDIAQLLDWDARPLLLLSQLLQDMPSGEGRAFLGRFPRDGMLTLSGEDKQSLSLSVDGQGRTRLRGQGLDLALLDTLDQRWQWQGSVPSLNARWPAGQAFATWPETFQLEAVDIQAQRQDWQLAANTLAVALSQESAQALPASASLSLQGLQGNGPQRDWQSIDVKLELEQARGDAWQLRFDFADWLQATAQLQGLAWPQSDPDQVPARTSLDLRRLDLSRLPVPGLSGHISGEVDLHHSGRRDWRLQQASGELSQASLSPWLQELEGSWQGKQVDGSQAQWHLAPTAGRLRWQQVDHGLSSDDQLVFSRDDTGWQLQALVSNLSRRQVARSTQAEVPRDLHWWWWRLHAGEPQAQLAGLPNLAADAEPSLPLSRAAQEGLLPFPADVADQDTHSPEEEDEAP